VAETRDPKTPKPHILEKYKYIDWLIYIYTYKRKYIKWIDEEY
jgi:hypothetical protein